MKPRDPNEKLKHLDAAKSPKSQRPVQRGALDFRDLRFWPQSLPELNLREISIASELLKKPIAAPIMIAPMTGGVERGGILNRRLAEAAERHQLPMGVGSQRIALEQPAREADFRLRQVAPSIPLFGNLGAVQLVKGYGFDEAARAVSMLEADALFLHLNPMQEAVQVGGDTEWSGVLRAIEALCEAFEKRALCPIFVREVGFGLCAQDVARLVSAGVQGFDCAGQGGTSWAAIEGMVSGDPEATSLGEAFSSWGLSTAESLLETRRAAPNLPIIATGGLKSATDVAKLIALGADLGAMARPFLLAAEAGEDALDRWILTLKAELRALFFALGKTSLADFRADPRLLFPGQIAWPTASLDLLKPALLASRPLLCRRSEVSVPLPRSTASRASRTRILTPMHPKSGGQTPTPWVVAKRRTNSSP